MEHFGDDIQLRVQVRAAIDDALLCQYTMPKSWAEASERHQLLYTERPTRLQF